MIPLYVLSILAVCAEAAWPVAAAKHLAIHQHQRQQRGEPISIPATPTSPVTTYTVITPSPSASPVAVTSLSQVVTSYVPQMTICAIPSASSSAFSRWTNSSNALALVPRTAVPSLDCTTQYSETVLTVCATMLQGLGSTVAITECDQQITVSSQYGYSIVPALTSSISDSARVAETTVTSSLSIATITSYYIAPWQALTTPLPVLNVTQRICNTAALNATTTTSNSLSLAPTTTAPASLYCIDIYEVWSTSATTIRSSFTSSIDISTHVPTGRKVLIVGTLTTSLKEEETLFKLKTEMVLPTTVAKEVAVISTVKAVSSTSTMVVWPATATATVGKGEKARVDESTSTSTTTFRSTSTLTRTITLTTTIPPKPTS